MRYFHSSSKSFSVIRTKAGFYPSDVQATFFAKVFAWVFENDSPTAIARVMSRPDAPSGAEELRIRTEFAALGNQWVSGTAHRLAGWVVTTSNLWTPSEDQMLTDFSNWFEADKASLNPEERDLADRQVFTAINLNCGRVHVFIRR